MSTNSTYVSAHFVRSGSAIADADRVRFRGRGGVCARAVVAAVALVAPMLGACSQKVCTGFEAPAREDGPLQQVADFGPYQVTGVAVSSSGRVFVNFPRWGGPHRYSVGEVQADGTLRPYPDEAWNEPQLSNGIVVGGRVVAQEAPTIEAAGGQKDGQVARTTGDGGGPWFFSCVQSVHIDDKDRLWVLDNANPQFAGVRRGPGLHAAGGGGGGPKLVQIDLATNQAVQVFTFDPDAAPYDSYLNDVRIDSRSETAYVTDSGAGGSGAIVVLDLGTGKARRLLANDLSTQADPNRALVVQGKPVREGGSGDTPQIHADGLALDSKNHILYWQSLTGDRLYAADARLLRSRSAPAWQITNSVREVGRTCVTDGMLTDGVGDVYFTALENDAILRLDGDDARKAFNQGRSVDFDKALEVVVQDARLGWPDSLAIGGQGPIGTDGSKIVGGGKWLYITTSQIHKLARFGPNAPSMARARDEGGEGDASGDAVPAGPGYGLFRTRLK